MKENQFPQKLFGQETTDRERQCYQRGYIDAYKYMVNVSAGLVVSVGIASFIAGALTTLILKK